jgi:hypothetical protein
LSRKAADSSFANPFLSWYDADNHLTGGIAMAEVFDFGAYRAPQEMSKEELLTRLMQLQQEIAQLDEAEPDDMESEAYEIWGEQHEDLEDQLDEVRELLDEMK